MMLRVPTCVTATVHRSYERYYDHRRLAIGSALASGRVCRSPVGVGRQPHRAGAGARRRARVPRSTVPDQRRPAGVQHPGDHHRLRAAAEPVRPRASVMQRKLATCLALIETSTMHPLALGCSSAFIRVSDVQCCKHRLMMISQRRRALCMQMCKARGQWKVWPAALCCSMSQ